MLDVLPWEFLFFVPAVTMRSLAEDIRGGQIEVVLAQPVSELELLLGKVLDRGGDVEERVAQRLEDRPQILGALDRLRELEVLPGDVDVQVVEAHQPPAVVQVLLDGRLRHVQVRHVLRPPAVVLAHVGAERRRGGEALVGVVLGQRLDRAVDTPFIEAEHDLR